MFRATQTDTVGFIAYSEGCNDDVNKFVWNALGWDQDADVVEALRQYGRFFLGDHYADRFAQGLLALEKNWEGPLLGNASVDTTLFQFQDMERSASPRDLKNWRFQQALYRAYYDSYLKDRLTYETGLEARAMDVLRGADESGSAAAMDRAEEILRRATTHKVATDRRARVFELGEALFQSIHMQLSVKRYQAIGIERGANPRFDRPAREQPAVAGSGSSPRSATSTTSPIGSARSTRSSAGPTPVLAVFTTTPGRRGGSRTWCAALGWKETRCRAPRGSASAPAPAGRSPGARTPKASTTPP